MRNLKNRVISLIMTFVICLTFYAMPVKKVSAATEYITVESFAKYLAQELGLTSVKGNTEYGYVNALMDKSIIVEGDFTSYKSSLTRGDAMVLLNRADEFLYGDTTDSELMQLVIEKRISDISSIKESKREDVAKAYLKGFIKGYSNGYYSTNRNMKAKNKITKTGALGCIKMLNNKTLRVKVSPDGQLIRTTNLPKYAKYYPYILASFPNSFYDWKLKYETIERTGTRPDGTYGVWPFVNMVDYASPADLAKDIDRFDAVTDECLDVWVEKVRTHLQCVFNVDYRTINEDWVQKIWPTSYKVGDIPQNEETAKNKYLQYIVDMKANKTIVKSSMIAVDRSSIYYFEGYYHFRVYVKYCISSSSVKFADKDKLKLNTDYYFNNILFSEYYVRFTDFTLGKWRECCYDVKVADNQITNDDMLKLGVSIAYLSEYQYSQNIVK